MKVALLSNVNVDPINRQLKGIQEHEIYDSQGYGNELGIIINKQSPLYSFNPEMVFIIIDLMELIQHNIEVEVAEKKIDEWFTLFNGALDDSMNIYLSDAYLYGIEMGVVYDKKVKNVIEEKWNNKLYELVSLHSNVRILYYSTLVQHIGENSAFSSKMWYMGKILHSTILQKAIAEEIMHKIDIETRQPKKVLLLDLDNTLWRGLAGENDITPIILSEDGAGLAYKNFQRAIKQLKLQGVVLGIVSKNNEDDAISIINSHPHMVLRLDDFAVYRINWENKADNIVSICKELNIGVDSIVFIDDNKAEQTLIKETLPEVVVPDFPDRPEELTSYITQVYHNYFEKPVVTEEDKKKTSQYHANNKRKKLQEASVDFVGYLDGLEMKMHKVDPKKNKERLVQLINKTNQFNLTTKRVTDQEINKILQNEDVEVFLYRITDRFGDNGIVAVAIVEYGMEAIITEFTMSCRVMGRKIEDAIIVDIESSVKSRNYNELVGIYKPTEKNKPVEDLYPSFGYKTRLIEDDGTIEYSYVLDDNKARETHVEIVEGE